MLKVWNVSLVLATGILAILGHVPRALAGSWTRSTHSGRRRSACRSSASSRCCSLGSVALVVSRRDQLRSERRIDSLLSRETAFLLNNLVLVGLCFVDLLGHVLPADLRGGHRRRRRASGRRGSIATSTPLGARARAAGGDRSRARVGARDGVARCRACFAAPLGGRGCASLLALVAAGGHRAQAARARDVLRRRVRGHVRRPGARGAAPARGVRSPARAAAGRAALARAPQSPALRRLRVHVGMAVLLVGVAASSTFQHVRDARLRPGPERARGRLRRPLRESHQRALEPRRSRSARCST